MLVVHVHKMHGIVFSTSSWYDYHWQENQFPPWLHCFLDSVHATARWHLWPIRRGKSAAMYTKLTLARHCLRFDMRQYKTINEVMFEKERYIMSSCYLFPIQHCEIYRFYPIYTFDNHITPDTNNQQRSHVVSKSVKHMQTILSTHSGEPIHCYASR